MPKMIIKASGQKEPFNTKKFQNSLKRAGASDKTIEKLIRKIKKIPTLKTTQQIYYFALEELKKYSRPVAARYKIKEALQNLGPSGFPFEKFVAQLFEYQGYKAKNNVFIDGFCVDHEVDVVAQKDNKNYMVEAKFHQRQDLKTDVKVTLYVQARFEDILKKWKTDPKHGYEFHQPWLVTNTKFTTEAIRYATCINMNLLGWGYPAHDNIAQLIDKLGLHPITCLTSLTKRQHRQLIQDGFVLCKDVSKHIDNLKKLGLSEVKINQILHEAKGVCAL